jgi:hypothetical protein
MKDLGHWTCNTEVPDNPYGFVYCITNTVYQRKYVGKKQIITTRKQPPLKGKRRKRCKVIETDWKTYTSSSVELNNDIQLLGKDKFTFEILRFCYSKSELAYFEAKEQFDREVLLREDYYNGIINLRIGKIKKIQKV